jgi:hypothetical protein
VRTDIPLIISTKPQSPTRTRPLFNQSLQECLSVQQSVFTHNPCAMAVSPLVMAPGSASKSTTATNRPKHNASNGATPDVINDSNDSGRDLAEQMNEQEKQKYVKGYLLHFPSPVPTSTHRLSQARNSEKEPTPMYIWDIFAPTLQNLLQLKR